MAATASKNRRSSSSKRKSTRLAWLGYLAPGFIVAIGAGASTIFQVTHIGIFWLVAGSVMVAGCLAFLTAVWTDPKRRRTQNLVISSAFLAVLLAGAFGYHELFDPSAAAGHHTEMTPQAAIRFPRPGSRLRPGQVISLSGTAHNIPEGDSLWLVTDDAGDYQAVRELAVTPRGTWKAYVSVITGKQPAGTEDDVLVLVARNADVQETLDQQYYDYVSMVNLAPGIIDPNTLYRVTYFAA